MIFARNSVGVYIVQAVSCRGANLVSTDALLDLLLTNYIIHTTLSKYHQKKVIIDVVHRTVACDSRNMATVNHHQAMTQSRQWNYSMADGPYP